LAKDRRARGGHTGAFPSALRAKLAEARRVLAEYHQAFVELFGADLIVVPGIQVPATVEKFHTHLAQRADPDTEPPDPPILGFPDAVLDSGGAAIHFAQGEGLSFYPDYDLLEELFANPALISRRRYRETLSGFLRDPDTSPEPLRRLAARSPRKTDTVFTKLLKRKGGFSWGTDGEALLRKHKPSYFDGSLLPRTVPMSGQLSNALRYSHRTTRGPQSQWQDQPGPRQRGRGGAGCRADDEAPGEECHGPRRRSPAESTGDPSADRTLTCAGSPTCSIPTRSWTPSSPMSTRSVTPSSPDRPWMA
jgi:hypothetical protein